MNFLIKIWTAFILDLIFGDPEKITHPVQIIGKMITFLVMYGFVKLTKIVKVLEILEIYLMYTVFSVKSLAREGKRVYKILKFHIFYVTGLKNYLKNNFITITY